MTSQNFELSDADLDSVTGATSYVEAFANMAKWNAAITAAGQGGIEGGGGLPQGGPSAPPLAGPSTLGGRCPGCH
jgi:hypothetical protein